MCAKKVVIVGAGPVGLTMALCLAKKGIKTIILDKKLEIGRGSRAICFARHNLALFDEVGVYDRIRQKGESWDELNVYFGENLLFSERLNQDIASQYPAYLNLQQYYLEQYLQDAVNVNDLIDLRLGHRLNNLKIISDKYALMIECQDKSCYEIQADYVIAADGVKSTVRELLNLPFIGDTFQDKFLIVDIVRSKDAASERSFWFNAPFNDSKCVLMLKQPENRWRIDFQLGWEADTEFNLKEEIIKNKISNILAPNEEFTIEWKSIYTFKCRRMESFRYQNIFFIGDAAHEVSPFGARGANSGLQDAQNLADKFNRVFNHGADDAVFDDYNKERTQAADENIKQSSRSTRFISPHSLEEKKLRDLVLELATERVELRSMINSGRLSLPERQSFMNQPYDDIYNVLADCYSECSSDSAEYFHQCLMLLLSCYIDSAVLIKLIHQSLIYVKNRSEQYV